MRTVSNEFTATSGFAKTLQRLSRVSVRRGSDAYTDINWDTHDLDPSDPRLALPTEDPLAQTDWYLSLADTDQARIGLLRIAASLKTAWHFENILQQGLLHRALYLPNGTDEFRYIHHEIIEESQHTLMFEELVRRSGCSMRGMPRWLRRIAESLMRVLSIHSPVVFFSMTLGGEEPLDLLQRRTLSVEDLHPLVKQILQIHIAEEARHVSYARAAIREEATALSALRRQTVAFFTPVALAIMVRLMAQPTHDLVDGGVPREVLVSSYRSDDGRQVLVDGVGRIRDLLGELGLVTPASKRMWKALGIWG